jgi:hypothetical protein
MDTEQLMGISNKQWTKIMNAVVWNLVDTEGIYRGQAAAFEQYEYLT